MLAPARASRDSGAACLYPLVYRCDGTSRRAGMPATIAMIDPASRFSNLAGFAIMKAVGSASAPAANPTASQTGSLMTLAQLYDFARQQAVATQRLKWHALLERLLQ